jgi:very-short-patch-repair endonuclease
MSSGKRWDPARIVAAEIRGRARALRQPQTRAEHNLWQLLRGRRLEGFKFRRQAPVGTYIADFLCVETQLVVELDGDTHLKQERYDARRTEDLIRQGYRVLRFTNTQVCEAAELVLETILAACREAATKNTEEKDSEP